MIRSLAVIIGASLGLLYGLLLFITWKSGVPAVSSFMTMYAWLPVPFFVIGAGALWLQKKSGHTLDLKQLLQYGLLAYFIFELLYAVSNYALFGWLDKNLNGQLVQQLYDSTMERLKGQNPPKEKIEQIKEMADAGRAPLTISQVLVGFGQNMLIDFIKCLIIATITKQINKKQF